MKELFILFLFLISLQAHAQKEATNWYFGNEAGLDFSNGSPVPLSDNAMLTYGASAVISDSNTGELLFYTNGRNIWNREHEPMPNGQDFLPDCSNLVSQAALIVPASNREHVYYVFSIFQYYPNREGQPYYFDCLPYGGTPALEYNCEVRYSEIDMRLNAGLGDVVTSHKNVVLQKNATEKMTAIPHSNGRDFWLLTHAWNSNAFYVYLISPEGIAQPFMQRIGSIHQSADSQTSLAGKKGLMKASPDGRKLAVAVNSWNKRPLDLFDFDPATGKLSNYMPLGSLRSQYGVSFSTDNTKVYVSTDNRVGNDVPDLIWQFDLSAGDAQTINATGMEIIRRNPYTNIPQDKLMAGFNGVYIDMQLAPDGKLYAVSADGHPVEGQPDAGKIMVVINRPNEKGYACDINYKVFDLKNGYVAWGLPNFIQSYFNVLEPVDEEAQKCTPTVELYPNPTSGVVKVGLKGECAQTFDLKIVNAIGQHIIAVPETLQTGAEIDLSRYADGLYLFILTFPNQQQLVRKVVKA